MLGECPVEALRAGWAEMEALEAVAVEAEVLGLCTERAEAINRVIARQIQLGAAVAGLRASTTPVTAPATTDTPVDNPAPRPAIVALRAEIAALRQRINGLEERPGDAATLPPLRAALARKEAELAEAEAKEATNTGPVPGIPAVAPQPAITLPPATAQLPPTEPAQPGPPNSENTVGVPPTREAEASPWQMVWTARQGEGPWKAGFVRTTRTWVTIPSDDPAMPPSGEWAEETEGPFVASVNDCLPDGVRVRTLFPEDGLASLEADPACPVTDTAGHRDVSHPALTAFDVKSVDAP